MERREEEEEKRSRGETKTGSERLTGETSYSLFSRFYFSADHHHYYYTTYYTLHSTLEYILTCNSFSLFSILFFLYFHQDTHSHNAPAK